MATLGYIKISGAVQGEITKGATTADSVGNTWQEGHEDYSLVYDFINHAVVPCDPNSGAAVSSRRHQPTVFEKPLDKASPMLWQALATGEFLEITIEFWRTSTAGKQEHYFSVAFVDAVLVDGKTLLPDTNNTANDSRPHVDRWAFTARKVDWTHEVAGTSAADDWRTPVSS